MNREYIVDEAHVGSRLDHFLSYILLEDQISRSQIQRWIREGYVRVNGQTVKTGSSLHPGDRIGLDVPEPALPDASPQEMPLDIVYEDEDILIVNKPRGLVVHPSAGHPDGTLVNGLMYYLEGNLSGIGGTLRPGIVHRIDRDTTGLLVVCKNDLAHQTISERLAIHDLTRRYQAIVIGHFREWEGTIDLPIGRDPKDRKKMAVVADGRRAVTHYHVLAEYPEFSHIELELETGRTHQIRVHMRAAGHPVLADPVYGPGALSPAQKKALSGLDPDLLTHGQFLHAKTLGLVHPVSHVYMEWDSELPEDFRQVLDVLERSVASV